MATSGSVDFSINRDEIIEGAFRRLNIIGDSETLSAPKIKQGKFELNLLVKQWMVKQYNLWAIDEITVFPAIGQIAYSLGASTSDHATSSFQETTLSAAEAAAEVVLSVTSTTGMVVGDNIGVIETDGTRHWSTISAIGSGTVTFSAGLPTGADSGAEVVFYTAKAFRPLRIERFRRRITSTQEIPFSVVSREEYERQTNKTSTGGVIEVFYDPQITLGILKCWPPSSNETDRLLLTVQRPLENFDTSVDNPDFPIEWGNTIIWNLAYVLSGQYPVSEEIHRRVEKFAIMSLTDSLNFDRETTHVRFIPRERY